MMIALAGCLAAQPSHRLGGQVRALDVDTRGDQVQHREPHGAALDAAVAQHLAVHLGEDAVDGMQPAGVRDLQRRADRGHVRGAATGGRRGP